ncbi:phage tail protein [Maricaulis sp. D1M11]|uniref:phage tail protein n=1 Tax=Maricaulis sp. D1M11 TaxID=3076117 RepID=UPI0039B60E30
MKKLLLAAASFAATLGVQAPVSAQDHFTGQIMLFAGNFCPRNFTYASGQLLSISSNSALFSLLGTHYGGDGRTTFKVPDLNGRMPMGFGTGPGLTPRTIGLRFGTQDTVLTLANLPSHSHTLYASTGGPNTTSPQGADFATFGLLPSGNPARVYSADTASADQSARSDMISTTGSNDYLDIQQPVLGMSYCINTQGIYPSRN